MIIVLFFIHRVSHENLYWCSPIKFNVGRANPDRSLGCLVVEYFSGDKRFRKSVIEDGGVLSCAGNHGFHISWCEELI